MVCGLSLVHIGGEQRYLYRAVDREMQVFDTLVQIRRNTKVAVQFFRRIAKKQGQAPRRLVTDKPRSYTPARRPEMPGFVQDTRQYANNRAELSHETTRQRERHMRRFKSIGHAQLFLFVFGAMQNQFAIPLPSAQSEVLSIIPRRACELYEQVIFASRRCTNKCLHLA